MKATLEFDYPEDARDHLYALAGLDALLLINDVESEIREYIKHGGGYFRKWEDDDGDEHSACPETLTRVWQYIIEQKEERKIPYLD